MFNDAYGILYNIYIIYVLQLMKTKKGFGLVINEFNDITERRKYN